MELLEFSLRVSLGSIWSQRELATGVLVTLTDRLESLGALSHAGALLQVLLGRGQRNTFLVPALAKLRVVVTLECRVASVGVAVWHHDGQAAQTRGTLLLLLDEPLGVVALLFAFGFLCVCSNSYS